MPSDIRFWLVALIWVMVAAIAVLAEKIIRNYRERAFRKNPRRAIGPPKEGGRQFITGKAHSPVTIISPVSKTACVFYLEKVYKKTGRRSLSFRGHGYSTKLPRNAYGAFFVKEGNRTALVAPVPASVDINKPEAREEYVPPLSTNEDATIKMEGIIAEGELVTVLGTPRTLGEFMKYLRTNAQSNLPSEMVKELLKMESDPAGSMPCYFGSGVELVTDQSYEDYIARIASLPVQLGSILSIILLAAGIGVLLCVLYIY